MDEEEYRAGETEEERRIEARAYFIVPHEGDARYTAEGLPILTKSTRRAFMHELERSVDMGENHKARLRQWINETVEENPEVADFIRCAVSTYPEMLKFRTCTALLEVYRLLKAQMGNNIIFDYFEAGEKKDG